MAGSSSARRETRAIAALLGAGVAAFAVDLVLYYRHGEVLAYGISYVDNFINADSDMVRDQIRGMSYYPPVYYVFLYLVHAVVGLDFTRFLYANALFLPAGALYLAAFARRLGMGVWSFLPGVLLLVLPGSATATRTLSIEMPLVLIVPAFAYHLHAAERFRVTRHAVIAGVWAGLGMLTKWTFPTYVVGLALLALAAGLRPGTVGRARVPTAARGANLGLLVLAALLLCGWWYALNMRWGVFVASSRNDPVHLDFSYVRSLGDYLAWAGRAVAGSWPLAALAPVALGLIVGRKPLPFLALVALGVALPLAILALPVHGEPRYLYPLYPALALAVAWPAARARNATLRVALAVFLAGGTVAVRQASFAAEARAFAGSAADDGTDRTIRVVPLGVRPRADRVVDALLDLVPGPRTRAARVGVHPLYFNYHLAADYLRYEFARRGVTAAFDAPLYAPFDYGLFRDALRAGEFDVVIADCGPRGDCLAMDREWTAEIAARADRYGHVNQFTGEVVPTFTMADVGGDLALLDRDFRRTPPLDLGDGTTTVFWVRRAPVARGEKPDPDR